MTTSICMGILYRHDTENFYLTMLAGAQFDDV